MFKSELKKLFTALRKNFAVIALIAAAAVVVAVGYVTMYMTPVYSATAKIILHNGELIPITALYQNADSKTYIETCEEILNSEDLIQYFYSSSGLNLDYTVEELEDMLSVTAKAADSTVFFIEATAENGENAVALVNEFSRLLQGYLNGVSSRIAVNIISCDEVAVNARPSVLGTAALALVGGAFIASLAVSVFSRFGTTLGGTEDYKSRYKTRLLGTVPDFEAGKRGK